MPFRIIRQSIVCVEADAIVNTANPNPVIGGGTDRAVYTAAGEEELLEARRKIGEINPGDAAATPAFRLPYKIIIHTVSPYWQDGNHREAELLASCYRTSMELAERNGCASVAFPLLAAGSNGFPKDLALKTALDTIQTWLMGHDLDVILTVFDRESFMLSSRVSSDVRSYIEEHQVREAVKAEYSGTVSGQRRRENRVFGMALTLPKVQDVGVSDELSCFESIKLPPKEETFQAVLLKKIDESGETDPAIYKRANIDRKLFAKIRKDENYKPSRKTAIALALALHLTLDDACDLLQRAGFALSESNYFDLIIRYCFEKGVYNISDVDAILFEYDQILL